MTLREFGFKALEKCPNCGGPLTYLGYQKTGPPKLHPDQTKLAQVVA